jgi:hypothetical protein
MLVVDGDEGVDAHVARRSAIAPRPMALDPFTSQNTKMDSKQIAWLSGQTDGSLEACIRSARPDHASYSTLLRGLLSKSKDLLACEIFRRHDALALPQTRSACFARPFAGQPYFLWQLLGSIALSTSGSNYMDQSIYVTTAPTHRLAKPGISKHLSA